MNTKYIYLSALLVIVTVLSIGVFQLSRAFSGGFTIQNVENLNVSGDSVNGVSTPTSTPSETDEFGAVVNITRHNFPQGISVSAIGGNVMTISSGSVTFTAANICDNVLVTHTNPGGLASAQTNKLPTASSIITRCLQNKGDSRTIRFENLSEIPGQGKTTFTFQTNTGLDIFVASSSGTVVSPKKLSPGEAAIVRFTNLNGSSLSIDFDEFRPAAD